MTGNEICRSTRSPKVTDRRYPRSPVIEVSIALQIPYSLQIFNSKCWNHYYLLDNHSYCRNNVVYAFFLFWLIINYYYYYYYYYYLSFFSAIPLLCYGFLLHHFCVTQQYYFYWINEKMWGFNVILLREKCCLHVLLLRTV